MTPEAKLVRKAILALPQEDNMTRDHLSVVIDNGKENQPQLERLFGRVAVATVEKNPRARAKYLYDRDGDHLLIMPPGFAHLIPLDEVMRIHPVRITALVDPAPPIYQHPDFQAKQVLEELQAKPSTLDFYVDGWNYNDALDAVHYASASLPKPQ